MQTSKTGALIHKFCKKVEVNEECSAIGHEFSLQLVQQKIKFSAFGFFDMSFGTLGSVSVAFTVFKMCINTKKVLDLQMSIVIATYLVILIQFHKAESNRRAEDVS